MSRDSALKTLLNNCDVNIASILILHQSYFCKLKAKVKK